MCYHYRAGAALGGIAVIAAGWALETHRVAVETILGAALGLEGPGGPRSRPVGLP